MLPPGSVRLIGRNDTVISYPKPTDDYDDPLNWSFRRKFIHYGVILAYVGVTFSYVDIVLVGDRIIEKDLDMDELEIATSTSFRYLGMAGAGVVFIPLAYRYGRRPIYLASVLMQLVAAIWTGAAHADWEYQVASCLSGAGAAVAHALVPMTITDLFFTHQFATMYGLFVFAQGTGSFLAPRIASMINTLHGNDWRWLPWSMSIALGLTALLLFFAAEESTFIPNVDNQISAKSEEAAASERPRSYASTTSESENDLDLVNMSRITGGGVYLDLPPGPRSLRQRFALITRTGRPIGERFLSCFVILVRFPGVTYAALTYGIFMAWLSIFINVSATQLTQAPYNLDNMGLIVFDVGPLLAHIIGSLAIPPLSDRWIIRAARANGGVYEPEMRLWFALVGGGFVAAGILIFGIAIADKAPLSILIISYVVFSLGFSICLETSLTYITDCYHNMIGDAVVSVVFVRNALSALIWIGIVPWVGSSGLNDILIVISVAASIVILLPIPLLLYGRRGRIATAAKYRDYSLAATPPSSLKKIMGDSDF